MDIVALAADGEEAFKLITDLKPDVALVDIRMPKMSGLDLLSKLSEIPNPPSVLLLTTFTDDQAMIEGLCLGAKGYLLKDISTDRLFEAIRRIAKGETYLLPSITERISTGLTDIEHDFDTLDLVERLTKRETEILRLVGSGLPNRDIAHALGCGEGTVRNHMSTILSKLGVKDRTQALLRAINQGLI
jgi:DNA-binding NarL/FixJ family response regulator